MTALAGLLVWLTVAAAFAALDLAGLAEGLLLPGLVIGALGVARAIARSGAPRRLGRRVTAAAAVAAVPLAILAWQTGLTVADIHPDAFALGLLAAGLLAPLGFWPPARQALLRPLGLDPDAPVHAVAGAVFLLALAFSVVVYVDLQDEPAEAVEVHAVDSLVSLLGDVGLALAGVGFLQGRGLGSTMRRLDLRPLGPRQLAGAVLIAALFHVMVGIMEHVETALLPTIAALEDRFDYEFVDTPPLLGAILVSVAAGIGEETVFRGALQPRFGIVRTALLFGAIHVQYQLPGMVMIFLVGLGMGFLKARTSTTFAICVHVIYDLGAFLLPDV